MSLAILWKAGIWPGLKANIEKVPVWKNGHIVLHVYKRNWTGFFKRNPFDAIYVHNEPYALVAAQICWANARTLRAPFGFYSAQNILKHYPPPFSWLESMVYKQSAYAFPITEAVKEVLLAKKFRGRSTVCPFPLDPDIYRPRGSEEDRRLIPREENEVIIGYVGRIVEPKGLRTLAAALPSLRDLRWKLIVIGKGDFRGNVPAALERWRGNGSRRLFGLCSACGNAALSERFRFVGRPFRDAAELEGAVWACHYGGDGLRNARRRLILRRNPEPDLQK